MRASDVVKKARSQRGYRESGNNHQKYSPAVPTLEWSQNQPWCATFTCWVFLQCGGKPGSDFPLTASCLEQVRWGRNKGRFHSSPKVGDLMMIGPGGGVHVEIVVGVSGGTVTTVGGNTSGSWGGNYANGNGVYEKKRSASSAYGFVRPVYDGASGGAGSEDDLIGLKKGDKGERVEALQELLRLAGQGKALGKAGVDGDYGAGTAEALRLARKTVGSAAKKGYGDKVTGHAYAQLIAAVAKKL